jgi:hypothetical protein
MAAHKPPPSDEKPQIERFTETAPKHGASGDPEDFERIFRKVVKPGEKPVKAREQDQA